MKFMRNLTVALVKVFTPLGTVESNLAMPKSAVMSRTNYAIEVREKRREWWILFSPYMF